MCGGLVYSAARFWGTLTIHYDTLQPLVADTEPRFQSDTVAP